MNAQSDFAFSDGGPDDERLRAHDADFTPEPVVAQFLSYLAKRIETPKTILDPAAGAGVFGKVARELWPDAFIQAIEPRQEEWAHLDRYYDNVYPCTLEHALPTLVDEAARYDLIVTNPPFSLWRVFVQECLPLIDRGQLALLGLTGWGARSQAGYDLFESCPPTRQSRIPGTINFRGPGINPATKKKWSADTRDYCWWQWVKSVHPQFPQVDQTERIRFTWASENLPRLPGSDRRWLVKPGL